MTQLNKQQKEALEKIKGFFKSEKTYFFLLGDAGTGKSFTIAKALSKVDILPSEIIALAPSHKAKKVLQKFFQSNNLNVECKTIHSALGLILNENEDKGKLNLEKSSQNDDILGYKKLIIIDEISMLDDQIVDELINQVNFSFIPKKVILLGDIKQLPPINKMSFPALEKITNNEENTSLLTEVMRYDNPNLATFLNESKKIINYNLNIFIIIFRFFQI